MLDCQLAINPDYAQNPPIGYQPLSEIWSPDNAVRKVEFKLLQINRWSNTFKVPTPEGRTNLNQLSPAPGSPAGALFA
jgi:hypothetical protein